MGRFMRRRSIRFRLTALYCLLFLPAAAVLVVITYVLLVYVVLRTSLNDNLNLSPSRAGALGRLAHHGPFPTTQITVRSVTVGHGLTPDLRELLIGAGVLLVAITGTSVLVGWLVAGRVLQPLRRMTTTTRLISERNLHERLALPGPDDELKDLGDTIDSLLARLEKAFEAQRRFVANASHELRTPLMLSQTLLQVALADPSLTLDSLRAASQEAIEAGKDQAQLIDALLTLALSQQGLERREPVDLGAVVNDALNAQRPSAAAAGLSLDSDLGPATISGDARLISTLASNLLENAIRYNVAGGRVQVTLAATGTAARLAVTNTGLYVPPDQVSRLLEPFQRAPTRTAGPPGLGLGLAIVAEIAQAHHAGLEIDPQPEGGLSVAVTFPLQPLVDPS
jgi:signal transduction histidine kinase